MADTPENKNNEEPSDAVKKRNRVVGLSLAVFVVALAVISYFRTKGLAP